MTQNTHIYYHTSKFCTVTLLKTITVLNTVDMYVFIKIIAHYYWTILLGRILISISNKCKVFIEHWCISLHYVSHATSRAELCTQNGSKLDSENLMKIKKIFRVYLKVFCHLNSSYRNVFSFVSHYWYDWYHFICFIIRKNELFNVFVLNKKRLCCTSIKKKHYWLSVCCSNEYFTHIYRIYWTRFLFSFLLNITVCASKKEHISVIQSNFKKLFPSIYQA